MEEGTKATPPEGPIKVKPRHSYSEIIDRIAAATPGTWVPIDIDEIDGLHSTIKQTRLHQAGNHRGMKIATTSKVKGKIYARVLTGADGEVPR